MAPFLNPALEIDAWVVIWSLLKRKVLADVQQKRSSQNGSAFRIVTENTPPPHNIEVEQALLGSLFLDNDQIDAVMDFVLPSDFYRDAHQTLCRVIFDLRTSGQPVDSLIVADEMDRRGIYQSFGGDAYLKDVLNSTPHACNAVYYASIIRSKARSRAITEVYNAGLRGVYSGAKTPDEAIVEVQAQLDRISVDSLGTDPVIDTSPWPDAPHPNAFHGIAGDIVRMIYEHTESDCVAILVQLLVAFGNMIGRTAYVPVEADRHYTNLFACMVGPSSKARKGTSWGQVRARIDEVDHEWAETRILTGLSSGEGLIWSVRDSITKREPIKHKGRVIDYQEVEADAGVSDKRAMIVEPEFASALKLMVREGNILSAVFRRAWDEGGLRTLTKNSPAVATNAHISVLGHITRDELRRQLNATEAANGFGNRLLWVCVRRSKSLPFGGMSHTVNWNPVIVRLEGATQHARRCELMEMNPDARALWEVEYERLAQSRPGLLGAILGRAEAQVLRLSLVYCLLDMKHQIERPHLEAALALWAYCEDSAQNIFGDSLGDRDAEAVLAALRRQPGGMTRKEILDHVFSRNKSREELAAILGRLLGHGLAIFVKESTGGKPAERWFASSTT